KKLQSFDRAPDRASLSPVSAKDCIEQLLAQQEQLYELATSLEEEKESLTSERKALDKLKAELDARETMMLAGKATSIE
ncbi:hypothetical protein AAVH_27669, partial [Aphelenchoides avenae]